MVYISIVRYLLDSAFLSTSFLPLDEAWQKIEYPLPPFWNRKILRENTKTKLSLLPAFSSCVQLIHFVDFKQQLSSYKEQSGHVHHHNTLFFVVCHWLQIIFLEKQMKKSIWPCWDISTKKKKTISVATTSRKMQIYLKVLHNLTLWTIGVDFHHI